MYIITYSNSLLPVQCVPGLLFNYPVLQAHDLNLLKELIPRSMKGCMKISDFKYIIYCQRYSCEIIGEKRKKKENALYLTFAILEITL